MWPTFLEHFPTISFSHYSWKTVAKDTLQSNRATTKYLPPKHIHTFPLPCLYNISPPPSASTLSKILLYIQESQQQNCL